MNIFNTLLPVISGIILGIITHIYLNIFKKTDLKPVKIVKFKTEMGTVIGQLDENQGDLIYFYTIYDSANYYKETSRECINRRFLVRSFILFQP